jgi:tetraacyldisaccharide 4'-kinase
MDIYSVLSLFWLYRTIVALRNFCYDHGLCKSIKLPAIVISIGNLSMGGTGKTPATIFLAQALRDQGWRTAIVAAGYRRSKNGLVVVSDGQRLLAGIEAAGDEPLLMAQACAGIPVIVDRRKKNAAIAAVEKFAPDIIIVDDGFQHRQLHRDIDVVMLELTALNSLWLFPAAPMREPARPCAARILSSSTPVTKIMTNTFNNWRAKPPLHKGSSFFRQAEALAWRTLEATPQFAVLPPAYIQNRRVMLVCGIARPQSFRRLVDSQGACIKNELIFSDHHPYKDKDIRRIADVFQACGAQHILTTAKDAVKLATLIGANDAPSFLVLEIAFDVDADFFPTLTEAIRRKKCCSRLMIAFAAARA